MLNLITGHGEMRKAAFNHIIIRFILLTAVSAAGLPGICSVPLSAESTTTFRKSLNHSFEADATPEIHSERVVLISDRSLYITGERVHFSAALLSGDKTDHNEASVVLYTEIIAPDGKNIAKGKFAVQGKNSTGYLEIPEEVLTGFYYLRAYTRLMRNEGPEVYAYLSIRIINPYSNEVRGGKDSVAAGQDKPSDSNITLKISPDKGVYHAGEEITVLPELPVGTGQPLMVNISVIPALTYRRVPVTPAETDSQVSSEMCPENKGLSISGVLKDQGNGLPVSGRRINLSVIGDGKDFMAVDSDGQGRFYFTLPPLTGWRDLYLGTTGKEAQKARVFADNDFCSLPVSLPAPSFSLTDNERRIAVTMAGNARISNAYGDSSIKTSTKPGRPFYGTPDQVLVLSRYVDLPSLEEYFNEISGLVKVRSSGGRKYFKVTGLQPEMTTFEPLVLIDHVAVDDPQEILSAVPSLIDRIEMINQPYLKGDILYGGIVSIISKRGDFAGIDLPASGTFINYRFFNEQEPEQFKPAAGSPDARNTVFFGLLHEAGDGQSEPVTVIAPSTAGEYIIVISVVDQEGNLTESIKEFSVNQSNGQ